MPSTATRIIAICLVAVAALPAQTPAAPAAPAPPPDTVGQRWSYEAEGRRFRAEVVATGLPVPFALAFLPDGRMLVSERPAARLSLVDTRTGAVTPLGGLPAAFTKEDGGFLDVIVHPDYARNGWIYFSYAIADDSGSATAVERARIRDGRLVDRQQLFVAKPAVVNNGEHFGGRLVLQNGYLFITVGDRNTRDVAQDLGTHHGKILRIHDDGRVPADNPFVGRAGALPEIWSYGHRNPQGLALHPTTGELWESEHGPRGGDEINVVRRGANYGWPAITYGREYEGPLVGGGLTKQEGMEQPVHYYVPSIAPSGMMFYTGDAFPSWRGSIFIGAMALRHLNRIVIENGAMVREERLLLDRRWRVRSVAQGPDGFIYLGVDSGAIVRLRP